MSRAQGEDEWTTAQQPEVSALTIAAAGQNQSLEYLGREVSLAWHDKDDRPRSHACTLGHADDAGQRQHTSPRHVPAAR